MNISLTLTLEQVNIVMTALGNAPYVTVAPVIMEIQRQATPQANAPQPAMNGTGAITEEIHPN